MWFWIGVFIAVVIVLLILNRIAKVIRVINSPEFQQKLREAQSGSADGFLNEYMANLQKDANTPPDPTPDTPMMRGRYRGWLAVRANSAEEVMAAFDTEDAVVCNWESASTIVSSMMNKRIFVTPPIDGWVLVFGNIPDYNEEAPYGDLWNLILALSKRFGEAQHFYYSSTVNANTWAKAVNGQMIRAYACAEDYVAWNDGAVTDEERDAQMVFGESGFKGTVDFGDDDEDETEENTGDHPDFCLYEGGANEVAARWSIDPESLYDRDDLEPSTGLLAVMRSARILEGS